MKKLLFILTPILLGLGLGAFFTLHQLRDSSNLKEIISYNGEWKYFKSMDLAANNFQKALIAKVGLFALRETEVIYFFANNDSDGNPLQSDYDYELSGSQMDARYWSITAYAEDDYLIPNEADIFSYNLENTEYTDSTKTQFTLALSSSHKMNTKNWLPTGKNENFSLLLRMYTPSKEYYQNLGAIQLPNIQKLKE